MKEIILISDFCDYYDYRFLSKYDPSDSITLKRNMRNPKISRKQMLEFGNRNFDEVLYSYKKSDFNDPSGELMVVEHLDEYAHAGEGKRWVTLDEAGEETLKVQYIGNDICNGSESFRHLYIGNHQFILKYSNDHDWRSNGPGCKISLTGVYPGGRPHDAPLWSGGDFLEEYPLLAFDFIKLPDYCCDDCYYHYLLDINTSPSWKGTFLEEMLHPVVVYDWIMEYLNKH
jgi:hypothetical protein